MDRDKIKYRLVKTTVEVKLNFGGLVLKGITTGLDINGLGARVNIVDYPPSPEIATMKDPLLATDIIKNFIGDPCKVSFLSEKLFFLDVFGSLLRVEDSRNINYTNFIAIKFLEGEMGLLQSDREKLIKYIQLQEKEKQEGLSSPDIYRG